MKRRIRLRRRDGIRQRYHVLVLAHRLTKRLQPHAKKVTIAGSIRRLDPFPNDIDLVVIPQNKEAIRQVMARAGRLTRNGDKFIQADIDGVKADVFFTTPESFGAELMTRTGPAGANIGNRSLAKSRGLLLNQYGLFKGKKKLAGRTEQDIYTALGKAYKRPEERT